MTADSDKGLAFGQGPLAKKIRERKRPLQARAQRTVAAIIEGTAQILAKSGVAGLNTNKVAERSGVSIGTLYQYFPDKASLLAAVQADFLKKKMKTLRSALQQSKGGTLEEVMSSLIDFVLRMKRDNLSAVVAFRDTQMESWMREASEETLAILTEALGHLVVKPSRIPIVLHALEGVMIDTAVNDPRQLESAAFAGELKVLALSYLKAV